MAEIAKIDSHVSEIPRRPFRLIYDSLALAEEIKFQKLMDKYWSSLLFL